MRHHHIALKILLGLFLCLAIKTASAYSLAVFNNKITAFSDTEKKVIKLVFDAERGDLQTLHVIINNRIVAVERNSAVENQRAQPDNGPAPEESASEEKSTKKKELILRPVPGHDNQVVIDLNDNSAIMGASGILVELRSSEQSMNFARVQRLMALDGGYTQEMATTMPGFSIFNILTVRGISDFIWGSVTGDPRTADSDSSLLFVPEALSMNATVRNSALDSTYITSLSEQSTNPINDGISPPDGVMWFIENNMSEYSVSHSYPHRNTPVPFQITNQSVPVTLTYINRQRIHQITRADDSEARNEQQMLNGQLQRMLAQQQDARNLFYSLCLFPAHASR